MKGAEFDIQNDSLQRVILAALLWPGAAPRVPRALRPGRVPVSRGPGTTTFCYGLCDERQPPYLCEALFSACLVKLHPH
jgi:hypothetical protein